MFINSPNKYYIAIRDAFSLSVLIAALASLRVKHKSRLVEQKHTKPERASLSVTIVGLRRDCNFLSSRTYIYAVVKVLLDVSVLWPLKKNAINQTAKHIFPSISTIDR